MKFTYNDFDHSYDRMKYLRSLINGQYGLEEEGIDITNLQLYSINSQQIVYWVADERGFLGIWDDYEVDLCFSSDKGDSRALEVMISVLETAAKYEDLLD